jgi:phosphohistidine phosphatase
VDLVVKRTVLLLRHARTEDFRPGFHDRDRRLTERGEAEAAGLGAWLRGQGHEIDQVLCSTATRTRQTLAGLALSAPVDFSDSIYSGGAETIVTAVRELDDAITRCLIIGHSPAIPTAARDLVDPASADPAALTTLERRYPPGSLTVLEFDQLWADADAGRLITLRLP